MRKNDPLDVNDEESIQRFADELRRRVPNLEAVILFGSVARGAPGDSSDIDALIVINDADPERFSKEVSSVALDTMGERDIQPVVTNLKDMDSTFLSRILREGRVIFGKVVVQGDKLLQPMRMISYTTKGSSISTASRISQIVHGYKTKKRIGNKEYVSEVKGIGWSPVRGLVILPEDKAKEFESILKRRKIKFRSYEIWR